MSSPNDVEGKRISDADIGRAHRSPSRIPAAFIAGLLFAWIVSKTMAWNSDNGHDQEKPQETTAAKFSLGQRDTIVSLATVVGLPRFAELYFSAPGPLYYNEGDLSYALAAESNKATEIEKYRKLISLTLGTVKDMAPESQANLFYSMGKLDLLLSDNERAASDFKNAIAKSRDTVEAQAKADTKTHKYLIDSGLL